MKISYLKDPLYHAALGAVALYFIFPTPISPIIGAIAGIAKSIFDKAIVYMSPQDGLIRKMLVFIESEILFILFTAIYHSPFVAALFHTVSFINLSCQVSVFGFFVNEKMITHLSDVFTLRCLRKKTQSSEGKWPLFIQFILGLVNRLSNVFFLQWFFYAVALVVFFGFSFSLLGKGSFLILSWVIAKVFIGRYLIDQFSIESPNKTNKVLETFWGVQNFLYNVLMVVFYFIFVPGWVQRIFSLTSLTESSPIPIYGTLISFLLIDLLASLNILKEWAYNQISLKKVKKDLRALLSLT